MKVFKIRLKDYSPTNGILKIKLPHRWLYIKTQEGIIYFFGESKQIQELYNLLGEYIYSIEEFGHGYTLEYIKEKFECV